MLNQLAVSDTTRGVARDKKRNGCPALSAMDSERFGVTVARHALLTAKHLAATNEFCRVNGVDLLIARCPATDTASVTELERDGFLLMDTLVYWRRALTGMPLPASSASFPVRSLELSDARAIGSIASEAFRTYTGHYHMDPRLDASACTETYVSWATRCIREPGVADAMLGAEHDGQLVGFVALKCLADLVCDIMLAAVVPAAQGRGVFRTLIVAATQWMVTQGCHVAEYSCVLTNIGAQKALARAGFEIDRSYHTFHKWFPAKADDGRE